MNVSTSAMRHSELNTSSVRPYTLDLRIEGARVSRQKRVRSIRITPITLNKAFSHTRQNCQLPQSNQDI